MCQHSVVSFTSARHLHTSVSTARHCQDYRTAWLKAAEKCAPIRSDHHDSVRACTASLGITSVATPETTRCDNIHADCLRRPHSVVQVAIDMHADTRAGPSDIYLASAWGQSLVPCKPLICGAKTVAGTYQLIADAAWAPMVPRCIVTDDALGTALRRDAEVAPGIVTKLINRLGLTRCNRAGCQVVAQTDVARSHFLSRGVAVTMDTAAPTSRRPPSGQPRRSTGPSRDRRHALPAFSWRFRNDIHSVAKQTAWGCFLHSQTGSPTHACTLPRYQFEVISRHACPRAARSTSRRRRAMHLSASSASASRIQRGLQG